MRILYYRWHLRVVGIAGVFLLLCGCDLFNDVGTNQPIINQEVLADPHAIKFKGFYYIYGTSGNGDHFDVFTSDDGKNWGKQQEVFNKDTDSLRAPNVFHDPVSGKFYLYYTLYSSIGVAESDTPLGPFKDLGILVSDAIDAFVYFEDGSYYLYYATTDEGLKSMKRERKGFFMEMIENLLGEENTPNRKKIYAQRMGSPEDLVGDPQVVVETTNDSEKKYSLNIVGGPWVFKVKDTYYLTYSGFSTYKSESVIEYATGESPVGPFQNGAGSPILYSSDDTKTFGKKVYQPGHNSVLREGDGKSWIYFHQGISEFNFGEGRRYTARGELIVDKAGQLSVHLGG